MVNSSTRATMTLYSDPECPLCHRTRIALFEKNISAHIEEITDNHWPEDIAAANPYGNTPTLVDRDLVLYHPNIILDYFEERFVQPSIMPKSPSERARMRQMLYRLDNEWFSHWDALSGKERGKTAKARKRILEDLTVIAPLFDQYAFFMSDEFSVLDCAIAPLLWRLPLLNIKLPSKSAAVLDYAERIYARDSFQNSLSERERYMR
jgi:RNA polymerase-associated protein